MAALIQNQTGLSDDQLIADTQGNILYGFRRVRSALLFVRFSEDEARNRAWVREFALNPTQFMVSSATKPAEDQDCLVNFLVSASGLRAGALGAARACEKLEGTFQDGARAPDTIEKLKDKKSATWHRDFVRPWDAVLLVVCTNAALDNVTAKLSAAGKQCSDWHLELGCALDEKGVPRDDAQVDQPFYEAFGYRDGISNVYFTDSNPRRFSDGNWSGKRPLAIALTPDPLSPDNGYGSYFAFRKLKQKVGEFRQHVEKVAAELLEKMGDGTRGRYLFELYGSNPNGAFGLFAGQPTHAEVREFVKGRIMGRYSNGAPVRRGNDPAAGDDNDFNYNDDRGGGLCPFHAHVRTMNARGRREGGAAEQQRDILRRSWAYVSDPKGRRDVASAEEAGLLFLCAQSSISTQFEFHQANLSNGNPVDLKVEPLHGPDYLVSQGATVPDRLQYGDGLNRFKRYAATIDIDVRASQFIELQGAEYLFAPSLSGLRALTEGLVR